VLLQSIGHCVEKPPWRVNVPILGRTVEMGDIIHCCLGAGLLSVLVLPVAALTTSAVLAAAAPAGATAGFLVRRYSPGQIGWRNFFAAFLTHHIRRKHRQSTMVSDNQRGVVYLSLWAPPPVFVRIAEQRRRQLIAGHVPVSAGYKPRPLQ